MHCRDEIAAAAREAGCHEFATAIPEGYDTRISERGSGLSGGQRQQIAIARAVLKGAPVLLLDEVTAAVDTTTERGRCGAVTRAGTRCTVLVVAHRLLTVLDTGRIVERGTHPELAAAGGRYAQLWRSWDRSGRRHVSATDRLPPADDARAGSPAQR